MNIINIIIDGDKYKISSFDTEETIKNSIALKKGIISQYIHFSEFDIQNNNVKINVLSEELKNINITNLKNEIDKLAKKWKDISEKEDIALEWLKVNRNGVIDEEIIQEFKKIDSRTFWGKNSIETSYNVYNKELQEKMKKISDVVEKEKKYKEKYNKYSEVNTTNFIKDSVIVEYDIKISSDPLDAFDNLSLSDEIPFVSLKIDNQVYYKTLTSFTPSKNWLEPEDNLTLTFKMPITKSEDWNMAIISYKEQQKKDNYKAVLIIESVITGNKDNNFLKNTIINSFTNTKIKIIDSIEKGIKGVFGVPEIKISKDIFLDLITNEPMVSHYIYIDEVRELSSKKNVIYLYFSPDKSSSQSLTVYLSDRTVTHNDIFFINNELLLFTPYLNVRVSRAQNIYQINNFKKVFSIVLDIYKKNFKKIVNEFTEFIPGFKSTSPIQAKKEVHTGKLKDLQFKDAELFIHGYPTSCEKKKQPKVIDKKDKKDYEKKGIHVMNYPKGSDNFFVCSDNEKFIHPGLMKNNLNNKEKYPYLPCCYPVNQLSGTKLYNSYLQRKEKKIAIKTTNIVRKKIVTRNKLGYLPKNLYYILKNSNTIIDINTFFRQGVKLGNNSFIEAVLLAFDKKYPELNDNAKDKYIQNFRTNLASQNFASIIQSIYDTNKTQITRDILNPDVPFDSKIFIGLLESYYLNKENTKIQIVIFERNEKQFNGEFEIPRYTQGYLYKGLDPNVPTAIIYKHIGIRSDAISTYHYELIVSKRNKTTEWYFKDKNIIKTLYSYFLRTYQLYQIDLGRYKSIPIIFDNFDDVEGQIIDRYGKTRGYLFSNNIIILTSPLPPSQKLDIVKFQDIKKQPKKKDVLNFIQKHKLEINKQDIYNKNKAKGITLNIHGIPYAYIPFLLSDKLQNVKEGLNLGLSILGKDYLMKTLENKKTADFLMQFVLYTFSIWSANNDNDNVEEFFEKNVIIQTKHDYNVNFTPRKITTNNNFFEGDNLIIDNQTTYDRLKYYVKFMLQKNKNLVLNYFEKIYLDNYYTYSKDFTSRQGQLVFIGSLSLNNWIDTQQLGVSNHIHIQPHVNIKEPYFFSHWGINSGKPIIFQNVKNGLLNRALNVSNTFVNKGYNLGYKAKPTKKENINYAVYYLKNGELIREGQSSIKVWRFTEDIYASLLFVDV